MKSKSQYDTKDYNVSSFEYETMKKQEHKQAKSLRAMRKGKKLMWANVE